MCESVVESRTNVTNKIRMYMLTNLCSAPGFSKTTESEETSYLHTYFFKFLLHFYMYVYAYVWACAYHDTYIEVRGQPVGVCAEFTGLCWLSVV